MRPRNELYAGVPDVTAANPWADYRKCPVCKAETNWPCTSRSGEVVGGRPNGVLYQLDRAHTTRKRRAGR